MHFRSSRLRVSFMALFVAGSLVLAVIPAGADHLPPFPPATYSASVTPVTCEATADCLLGFTITNNNPPTSAYLLDAATITAPAGFTISEVGDPTTSSATVKSWNAGWTEGSSIVTLSAESFPGDSLAPTESVSVTVTVVASLAAVGPGHVFETTASGFDLFHPNDPEFEFGNSGSDPEVAVVNDEVTCEAGQTCQTSTIKLNNTSASAAASVGATQETLTISLGGGYRALVSGPCASSFTAKGEAVTTNVTGEDRSHVVTVRLSKVINNAPGAPGASNFDICLAAEEDFETKPGTPEAQQNAAGLWEGVLPTCNALNPLITKCVQSRTRNSGDAIIKYFANPGDPIGIPGLDQL